MFGIGARDLGIDLGTANTLVFVKGKGIVVREPSVVALQTDTKQIVAVGNDAKNMIGRTPGNVVALRPMKDGVIADYETTATMMKHYISKAVKNKGLFARKPYVMVCVPSGITAVEQRAVIDATRQAGARDAYPIEEPFAAAIGANPSCLGADWKHGGRHRRRNDRSRDYFPRRHRHIPVYPRCRR